MIGRRLFNEASMTTLLSRILRPRRRTSHLKFTVYTRAQCCCCHKALELLKDYQKCHGFSIEEVDIDADPELRARYNTEVPVVAIQDKVRFRGVVNRALLERLLSAEMRSAGRSVDDGRT
jgi:glutaredoxin